MALLKIVKYGNEILEKPTKKVEVIDDAIRKIVLDMLETMYAAPGIGLAANQVGIPLSIAVIDINGLQDNHEALILINPEIINQEGSAKDEEGCLSFPEIFAPVDRPERITVKAYNLNHELYEITGEGLLARAMAHEIDHLVGRLFIERMSTITRELIKKQISKKMKQGEW
ncbi:MAG: peptide deformylase [Candidatus Fischerbacteria bacterium RBG_13_37_8]|uniref:Peptide deformylase n=1 Tax=Candidatus Fischerbacteria bacterium RBG_13_37_8 TaxID=1817863 RepID=A0A1F5V5Y9_9BACT|nr:MAG: peptide deformylase [Candidatus Fischerbacteria bacterium RBG_13_37_8]